MSSDQQKQRQQGQKQGPNPTKTPISSLENEIINLQKNVYTQLGLQDNKFKNNVWEDKILNLIKLKIRSLQSSEPSKYTELNTKLNKIISERSKWIDEKNTVGTSTKGYSKNISNIEAAGIPIPNKLDTTEQLKEVQKNKNTLEEQLKNNSIETRELINLQKKIFKTNILSKSKKDEFPDLFKDLKNKYEKSGLSPTEIKDFYDNLLNDNQQKKK